MLPATVTSQHCCAAGTIGGSIMLLLVLNMRAHAQPDNLWRRVSSPSCVVPRCAALSLRRSRSSPMAAPHILQCFLAPNSLCIVPCCLPGLQRIGLKALRVWGFNSAFPSAPGQYSDEQGKGLDYVIAEAGKRGLRIELALANFWNGEPPLLGVFAAPFCV
jgi:hypothetical protein